MQSRLALILPIAAAVFGLAACKKEKQEAISEPPAVQGRKLYLQYCIACHNGDPKQDGMVGPSNAGASVELLRAKILTGKYPPGYTPKRTTNAMPPIPTITEDQIKALHAYLNQ